MNYTYGRKGIFGTYNMKIKKVLLEDERREKKSTPTYSESYNSAKIR